MERVRKRIKEEGREEKQNMERQTMIRVFNLYTKLNHLIKNKTRKEEKEKGEMRRE